jgi:predicted MFS family arabinose efflux permease
LAAAALDRAETGALIKRTVPLRRNRDLQLLWIGESLSELGSRIAGISIPLLVLASSHSPAKLGLTGFVGLLPLLLFTLPAGALLDRWNRRRVMLICQITRALAVLSLALAVAGGRIWFPLILAVFFLDVTGAIFFSVAERSALPQIVPADQMRSAVAQNQAREYGAGLIGRPLGGFLFSLSRALPFLVDACSYAFSIASLALIRRDFQEAREPIEPTPLRNEIREGLRWLWHQRFLRTISLLVTASDLNVNALYIVVIVIAKNEGASSTLIGVIVAFIGVGGITGAALAPWTSRHASARVAIGATLSTMTLLLPVLLLVAQTPIALGIVYGAMFVAYPTWSAVHWAYFAALVPDRLQGRVQSIATLLSLGPVPFGVLLAGVGLQWIGSTATVWTIFGLMLLASFIALRSKEIRNVPPLDALARQERPTAA